MKPYVILCQAYLGDQRCSQAGPSPKTQNQRESHRHCARLCQSLWSHPTTQVVLDHPLTTLIRYERNTDLVPEAEDEIHLSLRMYSWQERARVVLSATSCRDATVLQLRHVLI